MSMRSSLRCIRREQFWTALFLGVDGLIVAAQEVRWCGVNIQL